MSGQPHNDISLNVAQQPFTYPPLSPNPIPESTSPSLTFSLSPHQDVKWIHQIKEAKALHYSQNGTYWSEWGSHWVKPFQSLLVFWVWQVEETESAGWKCILSQCIEFRGGVHYEKVLTSCTCKPQCCIFTFTSSFSSWLGVSGNDRTARKEREINLTKQWIVTSSFNNTGDWGLNVQVNLLHLRPQLKVFSDRCPWCWTPTVTSLNTALPSGFH